MRSIAVYMGGFFLLLLGSAGIVLSGKINHKATFDEAMLCEARGGAWVYDAVIPLCMTPEDGLLELVDGSFVAYTSADPWDQLYTPPFQSDTKCKEEKMEEYEGRAADVDFSSLPEAAKYRTAITRDMRRGINFAGSYIVSTWGCARRKSDACVGHAIVDARTGKIVLYDVIGQRSGEFSLESNRFSVTLQDGEEKMWSIENDELVECE